MFPGEQSPSARIIRASLRHPVLVLLAAAPLAIAGLLALRTTAVDALPDLGDTQVIVRTSFPGQAPRIVEDQVTFPIATALQSVPGATTIRGYSFFADSFVYVLFSDGTDPDRARSRVRDYLGRVTAQLPSEARPALGPDATSAGWIYEYALVDRTGRNDIAGLRSLQDWWLRFQLQSVAGVAEVASIGGMVKEYQVVVDPDKLRAYGITLAQVGAAITDGNRETGASVIEQAEAEYMVRASGYIRGIEDLKTIPLVAEGSGAVVSLGDVASVRLGPQLRRGVADLDGEGEVAGGIVVLSRGANPQRTIDGVKKRLATLANSLPAGVEIVPTYDRSALTDRAISNLGWKLCEEFVAVLAVCILFLYHLRSGLVIVVFLPLGVLASFLIMRAQGVEANIMSLAGIAIAMGAMVDAAIVMIENVHKRLERQPEGDSPQAAVRREAVAGACIEVGSTLFISLLIVALSFLPVLALEAQEGRLFKPLAYTKTYAMVAAALLSLTVVPALIMLLVRGNIRAERDNPVSRACAAAYRPALGFALRHPFAVCLASLLLVVVTVWPATRLGAEFMPDMDEGDLLYMPVTLPGISVDAARALLQKTDALIRQVPEVERVFGKAGRAETATDPAPVEMFETVVKLKPRSAWRPGITLDEIKAELDARVRLPGMANSWLPPIKARIDMLSTGIRTALGLKIAGADPREVERIGTRLEAVLKGVPGARDVYAERISAGRYIDIDVDRTAAARYGLSMDDVQEVIASAVGGRTVTQTVEGRERYPVSVRYPAEWRDSLESLRMLPIVTARKAQIVLGDVASVRVAEGPTLIRSEDATPVGWVYIGVEGGDLGSFVKEAQRRIEAANILPAGYTVRWTGQYEHLERAFSRLKVVVPITVSIIVLLLYVCFRRVTDVALVLGSLPVALVGSAWLLWLLGYRMSVAVAVGFIGLAGVAAETGIIMLLYLNNAWRERRKAHPAPTRADLQEAIVEGALLRLRPKLMTVVTIIAGLLPMLFGVGAGAEVMRRIAAPMVGGMVSATLLTLLVIPALFLLVHRRALNDVSP